MKPGKIFLSVVAAGLIILALNSCSKSSSNSMGQPTTGGAPGEITITGMSFPATTTVAKGTKVSWLNNDGIAHTVASDDNVSFNSGNLASGATFTYQANTAGTFTYHCNYHSVMKGTLVVTP